MIYKIARSCFAATEFVTTDAARTALVVTYAVATNIAANIDTEGPPTPDAWEEFDGLFREVEQLMKAIQRPHSPAQIAIRCGKIIGTWVELRANLSNKNR